MRGYCDPFPPIRTPPVYVHKGSGFRDANCRVLIWGGGLSLRFPKALFFMLWLKKPSLKSSQSLNPIGPNQRFAGERSYREDTMAS